MKRILLTLLAAATAAQAVITDADRIAVLTGTLVPEPATAAMGLLAAAGLAARRKRKALCKE